MRLLIPAFLFLQGAALRDSTDTTGSGCHVVEGAVKRKGFHWLQKCKCAAPDAVLTKSCGVEEGERKFDVTRIQLQTEVVHRKIFRNFTGKHLDLRALQRLRRNPRLQRQRNRGAMMTRQRQWSRRLTSRRWIRKRFVLAGEQFREKGFFTRKDANVRRTGLCLLNAEIGDFCESFVQKTRMQDPWNGRHESQL
eukprot:s2731_g13.t1